METQNVTLALSKEVLYKAKSVAHRRKVSLSRLLCDTLETIVAQDEAYERAKEDIFEMMQQGLLLGATANITWTRDELHDRKL